jgi:hypothetical protein
MVFCAREQPLLLLLPIIVEQKLQAASVAVSGCLSGGKKWGVGRLDFWVAFRSDLKRLMRKIPFIIHCSEYHIIGPLLA